MREEKKVDYTIGWWDEMQMSIKDDPSKVCRLIRIPEHSKAQHNRIKRNRYHVINNAKIA